MKALAALLPLLAACAGERYLLRSGAEPEWEEFASRKPHGPRLDFPLTASGDESMLFIRQRDVKQAWIVELNGRKIGELQKMEQSLIHALAVPLGALRRGENTLSIVPPKIADDIEVGEIRLGSRLEVATLEVEVNGPCRITVADREGALAPVFAEPDARLAVRTGVVYTIDGRARFGVPPGAYTVYAGRGFEWSVDAREVSVAAGETRQVKLAIRREVPTPGWVACDTHIHTLELSGHGDATVAERRVTLAGEGIELAITTEHNKICDYGPSPHFTSVMGNEVTTNKGHFNVFPGTDAKVVILNHPRDVHAGFRPFGPENFNPVTGELRNVAPFMAMEVLNSGALQSDPMQLFRDWFALLNAGRRIAGVGASDSHDVSRYIVGQGRTYVECPDGDPSRIDVRKACESFETGRVRMSFGLLARLEVDLREREILATAIVEGPSWTSADRVELYDTGVKVREERIEPSSKIEKARVTWTLPRPRPGSWLVAIASGPGVTAPYWPSAKPYQPTSRSWTPRVLGSSGAVFIASDK